MCSLKERLIVYCTEQLFHTGIRMLTHILFHYSVPCIYTYMSRTLFRKAGIPGSLQDISHYLLLILFVEQLLLHKEVVYLCFILLTPVHLYTYVPKAHRICNEWNYLTQKILFFPFLQHQIQQITVVYSKRIPVLINALE